jgi:iron complex outermembrane receptor protein
MTKAFVVGLLAGVVLPAAAFAQPRSSTVEEVVVVAPSGTASTTDPAKLGSTVQSLGSEDLEDSASLSITEGLQRRAAGFSVSDTQGNPLTGDVNYRGFAASPLQGSPQGLAVYLDGQRLNEGFGDTVNWDLIPQVAIRRLDIFSNNPVYGLNALGGAISLHTKDGFSAPGLKAVGEAGSFDSREGSLEGGWNSGVVGLYGAIDGGQEDGFRDISGAKVARGLGDLAIKSDKAEFHLTGAASYSRLGVTGPTPVDLLAADRGAVYTNPQVTQNRARMLAANGSFALSDTLTLEANAHIRRYDQRHLDGNDGDFESCSDDAGNPLFGALCLTDEDFPAALRPPKQQFQITDLTGVPIACPGSLSSGCNTTPYGTLDRARTRSITRGADLQLVSRAAVFGRPNNLVVGASVDHSEIRFGSTSTLAAINPDLSVTTDFAAPGVGEVIRAGPAVAYGPVDIHAFNRQSGLYFNDTLDLTDRLFLTFGGRYNRVGVRTADLTGFSPDLNAASTYTRFNPAASLAFKVSDALTVYAGYSENNRAPTPLELGCSNPLKPCLLENSLVADPPLKQVLARTYEGGARGKFGFAGGRFSWEADAYQTENRHDIVNLASALAGRGYFANVPGTRRSGFDLSVDYRAMRWSAYAAYSYVRAEYRFDGLIASPNAPQADEDGAIEVQSGDRLGGIPPQRLKLGLDYDLTEALTVGADLVGVSSQYFAGDENNLNSKLPAYATVNLRGEWKVGDHAEIYARVDNLLDKDYATFGTYFDPEGVSRVMPNPLPDDPDPRTVTPASPRRVSVGVRLKF